jgi:N-hydroxyarylamine O-acetyltransferase
VCAVPFENLDVQLQCPVSTSVEAAYKKIVVDRRGGWCYEQNGLFGWVLKEIGFSVTRVAASVMRDESEASAANHLCLLVKLSDSNRKYLVDVGFGGSLLRPIELKEGHHEQPPFKLGLERLDDQYWRFWEDAGAGKFSYDFTEQPARESALAKKCTFLQSDSASNFVLNLVVQQRSRDQHRMLRGRVFTVNKLFGKSTEVVDNPEALVYLLAHKFGLRVNEVTGLWPAIVARHEVLFGSD